MSRSSPGMVLVTGVGRARSIGSGLALGLAHDGWDLVLSYWGRYDERLGYERGPRDVENLADACRAAGSRVVVIEADLASVDGPTELVAAAAEAGPLAGLVMSHTESVDSSILDTTLQSWERHFAVNARAVWLLIKAFAERLPDAETTRVVGRIIARPAITRRTTCPTGLARAPWTGLWWPPRLNSGIEGSGPT